ncbi:MAG TPA: aminodeoxychorismate/anthranilate synthase component II [Euzebyales bacterium]|nr:aminodeoxychorismate/anthranilate synthase component II [Euzebyales bacterium]
MAAARIFVIDNYDSFTYNLVQELGELGAAVQVARNDAFEVADVARAAPDGVVISPGPGTPDDAGLSNAVVAELGGRIPILGVCLGHQCIGQVHGASIVRAPELLHGKTSQIHHDGAGVFAGLPSPFTATRYHSLVIDEATLPADLEVTARTAEGLIMGVRHRSKALEGVQFHPESILTTAGMDLLRNFLTRLVPAAVA